MDVQVPKTVFLCLSFKHKGCERRHVYRNLWHFLQQGRQCGHDIVMAMGNEQTFDFALVFSEVCEIRNNHFDAKLIYVGIFQATFNDEYVVIVFNDIHVFSVLIKAAKGKNANLTHIIILRILIVASIINKMLWIHNASPSREKLCVDVIVTSRISPVGSCGQEKLTSLFSSLYPLYASGFFLLFPSQRTLSVLPR